MLCSGRLEILAPYTTGIGLIAESKLSSDKASVVNSPFCKMSRCLILVEILYSCFLNQEPFGMKIDFFIQANFSKGLHKNVIKNKNNFLCNNIIYYKNKE